MSTSSCPQVLLPPHGGAEILEEDTQTGAVGEVVLGGVETQVDVTDRRTRRRSVKDQLHRERFYSFSSTAECEVAEELDPF